jgi:hypothetical protein
MGFFFFLLAIGSIVDVTGWIIWRVVVLVRLVMQSLGELICVVFLFSYFVKLKDGVNNIGLCSLSGLKDLCYLM